MKQKTIYLFPYLFLFLILLFRLDSFQNIVLNIDEFEWIYTLERCYLNPVPFIGFDPHTSGPFAIYLLTPLKLIINRVELTHLRIYNFFVFIVPSFFFVYKSFKGKSAILAISIFSSFFFIYHKDFFAYNSEYPVVLFVTIIFYLLRNKSFNVSKLIILLTLIFILPLIKFQALLLSFFFFGILITHIIINDRKNLKHFIIIFSLLILIFVTLIHYILGLDLFFYSYVVRNVQYANSFSSKNIFDAIYENLYIQLSLFYPFYILIFVFVFFYIKNYFLYFIYSFKNLLIFKKTDFLLTLGLFIISLLSVLIPKTNFIHYFILMFPTLTFVIVNIISKLKLDVAVIFIILIMINLNYFKHYTDEVYNHLTNGNMKSRMELEKHKLSSSNEKEINYFIEKNIKQGSSLVILGWFKALPTYYYNKDKFNFPYRSGSTFCLTNSSFLKDKRLFNYEFKNFIVDVTRPKKTYLLDIENVLRNTKSNNIKNFINDNFICLKKTNNAVLYVSRIR
jgi:hypothetical protein